MQYLKERVLHFSALSLPTLAQVQLISTLYSIMGGRLVLPVGPQGASQWLEQYDKQLDGTIKKQRLMGVIYIPLTDKEKQVPS